MHRTFAIMPLVIVAAVLGTFVIVLLVTALSRKTPPAVRVILAVPFLLVAGAVALMILFRFGLADRQTATEQGAQRFEELRFGELQRQATARQKQAIARQTQSLVAGPRDALPGVPVSVPAAPPHTNNVAESLRDALRGAIGWGNRWQAEQQEVERKIQADTQALQEQWSAARKAQAEGIAKMQSELRRLEAQVMRVASGAQTTPAGASGDTPQKTIAAKPSEKPVAAVAASPKPAPPKPAPVSPSPPVSTPTAGDLVPANWPAGSTTPWVSTPPARDLVATEQRPEWADRPARMEEGQMLVTTAPYPTGAECDAAMGDLLNDSVKKYASHRFGPEAGENARLPLDFVRTRVVQGYWLQPITLSLGKMVQLHARLQFDRDADQQLQQQWQQVQQAQRQEHAQRRMGAAAGGLAALLYLVTIAYGYLKIDLSTKGAYRWRLRLAATALIALPVAALLLTVS